MKRLLVAASLLAAAAAIQPAHAQLTLNSAGTTLGFALTTFSTSTGGTGNFDNLSSAVLPDGNLVAVQYGTSLLKYADVDGQNPTTALASVAAPGVNAAASVGGQAYVAFLSGGIAQVASNLAMTPLALPGGFVHTWGLWANKTTGNLLAAAGDGIYNINPTALTATLVPGSGAFDLIDGIVVSPNGQVVYASANNKTHIVGLDITTGTKLFDSGALAGAPDGMGIISGGTLAGDLIINNNDGTLALLDPATNTYTLIATGGHQGDFTAVDDNNGSLFISNLDSTYRLTAPAGSFSNEVPEPASLALLGASLLTLAGLRRRGPPKGHPHNE